MPTLRYTIALLGVLALGPGCSSDPGDLTGSHGDTPGGDPSSSSPPSDPAPGETPAPAPSWGERTLARAQEWIDAKVPYCGGPNGGHDLICGGTCERTGDAKNPEWDKYRSDCSGFVSWSWGLEPPGDTTGSLAPFDTTDSVLITIADLAPGDALNNDEHVMLFGGWTDKDGGVANILEESTCGKVALEKSLTLKTINGSTVELSDGRQFRTIRARAATAAQ